MTTTCSTNTHECDGCGKLRRDVKAAGTDSNGDADGPDWCFICRMEWRNKNRVYDKSKGMYLPYGWND